MTSEIAVINPEFSKELIEQISDKINDAVEAEEELHAEIDKKSKYGTIVTVSIPVVIPNHMVVKTIDMRNK